MGMIWRNYEKNKVFGLFLPGGYTYKCRPEKSPTDTHPAQNKPYQSSSLSCLSPSASLTKPIKYIYCNYGKGTFDQSTKQTMWPRVYHSLYLSISFFFLNSFFWIQEIHLIQSIEYRYQAQWRYYLRS